MKTKILFVLVLFLHFFVSCELLEDDDEILVKTPTINTLNSSNIDIFSATTEAEVTNDGGSEITERGICWSTQNEPTINDSKKIDSGTDTSFSINLNGLLPLTRYYVKAYAVNKKGVGYGNTLTFTTIDPLTAISTANISNIDLTSASSGGTVSNTLNFTITERGICWNTNPNPTITDSKIINGSGSGTFSANMTGLLASTNYFVRAYATNGTEVIYGDEKTFKTLTILTLQPGAEGKDAVVTTGGWADVNRGGSTEFDGFAWTILGVPGRYRGVIDFDFTSIPQGSTIQSAYLSLYNDPTSTNNSGKHSEASVYPTTGGDNGAYLRRITSTWEEYTVTWATQPTTTSTNQVSLDPSTDPHQDYLNIDITLLIQDIINNKSSSFGLMLMLKTEVYYRALIFGSSDNANPLIRPKLVVIYK